MLVMPDTSLHLLLAGDDGIGGAIGGIAAAVGAIAMAAAAKARRRQRAAVSTQFSAGRSGGAQQTEDSKERDMIYVPINPGGSFKADSGDNSHIHPLAVLWFIIVLLLAMAALITGIMRGIAGSTPQGVTGLILCAVLLIVAFMVLSCLKVVNQWDRVVVLRFGKFKAVQPPGIFWMVPFADTIARWIDTRVQTDDLLAEETLTRDTVPVDVDAVMFWLVYDPKKAALEVEDYTSAVTWAAQTALRDLIGKTELAELLVGRDVLDSKLQEIIDQRTEPWGISVQSVEIREIKIPRDLQDAMSRQAQAERERQARVILGESEKQIAQSFSDAAKQYHNDPTALHLRAMNMLFEGLKEKGSLMIIPSSAIDSMNLGAMGGLASLGMQPPPAATPPPANDK